jgi:hypothetical protein
MPDVVAVVSITISLITTIGGIMLGLHLKKCHSLCCDSECSQSETPPDTPVAFENVGVLKSPPLRQTTNI